ncbi:melanocortin receptor 4-like [Oculina patagonica]
MPNEFYINMVAEVCKTRLEEVAKTVHLEEQFMLSLDVFYFVFSFVAIFGNLLVIRAIWKASSIPATLKKLLLSLAVSDLAVGVFLQPMYGIIIALQLKMVDTQFLCPTALTIHVFFTFLLAGASFLTIAAIALDRLLAVSLHLRYQELVTQKRVGIVVALIWLSAALGSSVFISLSDHNVLVAVVTEVIGFAVTTVAYFRVFKVVRYHQNQIQSQCQVQNEHTIEAAREKKSALNTLYVYLVFLACYLPILLSSILLLVDNFKISFLVAYNFSGFIVFLNSSLNPFVYCWRYREIRQIVKTTLRGKCLSS